MTARQTRQRKPRVRAQTQGETPSQTTEPESPNESVAVQEKPVEKPKIDTAFRKSQWASLDDRSRRMLGMTEKEFLEKEDVTGFGPNSYFTRTTS